ncbi:tetratricopeptide repeat protein [Vibrio sp. 1069]|uniref:tetratricopeptide repeat protein n=1 Tax=Vibrio TaxID=662 RepID=UPI0021CE3275|nr:MULTISPECIES: tetratricopeptide repeat protein [Vibrio]MDA0422824.1 sel1 repeat family protein [Vibrio alginolyticus]MDW2333298.1 tetratricopeptide repeat protein [Vibrio sp. 1069]
MIKYLSFFIVLPLFWQIEEIKIITKNTRLEKMYLLKRCVPVLLCAQMMSPGQALSSETNWYAKGLKAELLGNYQSAIQSYTESANSGVNQAGFALGRIYKKLGDDESSFNWFLDSATSGNKLAQYELGLIYSKGNYAVEGDKAEAIKWFIYSADAGVGEAAFELFKLEGDTQYLIIAAKQGVSEAILELSDAYKDGLYGLNVDAEESERWYQAYTESQE